jgi:hypothetical protein
MYYLVLIHILKFMCYVCVEIINYAYTLGTGIALVRLPLYLLTEIVVFMDIFFYVDLQDSLGKITKRPNQMTVYL